VDAAYTAIAGNSTGAGGDTGRPGCESGGVGGLGGAGGGIYNNRGTVVLRQSAVYGNTTGAGRNGGASGPGGSGGMGGTGGAGAGLFSNGQLPVTDTTITGNVTGNGGTGGSGARPGGGGAGGGIFQASGAATVQESTVASNTTGTGATAGGSVVLGPGPGSGFYVDEGPLTEINTIVSNDNCAVYLTFGQIKDGLAAGDGHLNLTYPATTTCPGIIADPHLGPLHDNGGPTSTMAITPPSPAIDRIPPLASAGCTPIDQRGIPRPQPAGGRCDIGAYEYQP